MKNAGSSSKLAGRWAVFALAACLLVLHPRSASAQPTTHAAGRSSTNFQCSRLFDSYGATSPVDSQSRLTAFEANLESYFSLAKIEFSKSSVTRHHGLRSSVFTVGGSSKGNSVSKWLAKSPAQIVIDPLLELERLATADYDSRTHTITLSPRALEAFVLNQQDFLRHELQHHAEQLRLEAGEFTLRRVMTASKSVGGVSGKEAGIEAETSEGDVVDHMSGLERVMTVLNAKKSVKNSAGDLSPASLKTKRSAAREKLLEKAKAYPDFLSFDELETYFGDLQDLRARKADPQLIDDTKALLKHLIAVSRDSLLEVDTNLAERKISSDEMMQLMATPWTDQNVPMNQRYVFSYGSNSVLGLEISFNGIRPSRPKRSQVANLIWETTGQILDRIDAIESLIDGL